MSLETPDKIRTLQRKLYVKAKAEPEFRFYLLHDKICRADILAHAFALARRNDGLAGVDGVTFEDIERAGVEAWLEALKEDLASTTYRPMPVRRVMIPKPGGGERPLGIRPRSGGARAPPNWFWSRSSRRTSRTVRTDTGPNEARATRSRRLTG
jgi:RNA-directed DNA polymerase